MNILRNIPYHIRLAMDSWKLGWSFGDKLKIVALCLVLPVTGKLGLRRKQGFAVRLRCSNRNGVYVIHDTIDLGELDRMFSAKEYELNFPAPERVSTIVDLGACSGASTLYFGLTYPNAFIYAIEPDPANARKLQQVADKNPSIKIRIIRKALSARPGPVEFYASKMSGLSSSLVSRPDSEKISVDGMTLENLASLISEPAVDIFKFDIEGGETILSPDKFAKRVKVYVGEIHPDLMDLTADQFIKRFRGRIERVAIGRGREIIRSYQS